MTITRRHAVGMALAAVAVRGQTTRRVFDVAKYGAKGDGVTLDTAAIQRAIDEASGAGGQVLVRGGMKYLVGTLVLRSGIDFHLADDAELVVSTNPDHYKGGGVLTAREAQGVEITGTGFINGHARDFMTRYDKENEWWIFKEFRPKMFVLTGCRDLQIRGVGFKEAPEWGVHLLGCAGVLVDGMKIRNLLDVPNCDGIDPDHCRDVEIRNCDIVCGDDAIVVKATRAGEQYGPCTNITVKDCVIETQDSGVKIGTETTDDIHRVRFERCQIKSSCRGLTIQLRDEGSVHDIDFRDIQFTSRYHSDPWWGRGEAISFTAIPRAKEGKIGTIHDVRVSNVTGKAENSVRINGTAESRIRNVTFDNVNVTIGRTTPYPGGLFDNRPTSAYPPIEKRGNPGFSIRHADNIALKRCTLGWSGVLPDYFTHAIEAESVTGLSLSAFSGRAAHPERHEDIVFK